MLLVFSWKKRRSGGITLVRENRKPVCEASSFKIHLIHLRQTMEYTFIDGANKNQNLNFCYLSILKKILKSLNCVYFCIYAVDE